MDITLVDALSALVRALGFIALFQAAGIATFIAIFGRSLPATLNGTRRVGVLSALVGLCFVALHYLLEAARMGGEIASALDPSLQRLVLQSSLPEAAAMRLVALVLIVGGLSRAGRATRALRALGVALAVYSFTLVGHTTTHSPSYALRGLLLAHLIVVVFWFGALVPLYRASRDESPAIAGAVTEAFSRLAVWIVPLLLVAGLVLAALLLPLFNGPSLDALWTTYGLLLFAKLAAFAGLMFLGALNKWRLGPALARGDASAAPRLRRSLAWEYLLIAGALTITAVLTSFYSPEA